MENGMILRTMQVFKLFGYFLNLKEVAELAKDLECLAMDLRVDRNALNDKNLSILNSGFERIEQLLKTPMVS